MLRKLTIALSLCLAFLAGSVAASSSERPVTELRYVEAEAGDTYYGIAEDYDCSGGRLYEFNRRASLTVGSFVLLPPDCVLLPPTTVTPTTTSTTVAPTTTSTTVAPTTTSTTVAPTTTTSMPVTPPGLYVDESLIPEPNASRTITAQQLITSGAAGVAPVDGTSAFRTFCRPSHFGFIDPLLYPGQARASHLHLFYGNASVDEHSDLNDLANTGGSTCTGGTANRSSYWAPAMIDTSTGQPIYDFAGYHGGVEAYYKSGYQGVAPSEIQPFPPGLRMIAGDSNATGPQSRTNYSCRNAGGQGSTIMSCPVGDYLIMTVQFPQCWDGTNLDSADHRSHMTYGTWSPTPGATAGDGCPPSHPVAVPEITLRFHHLVRPGDDTATWRLSSDVYDGPGGYSAHADWVNGWDEDVEAVWITECLQAGLDCRSQPIGDGRELDWISYSNLE